MSSYDPKDMAIAIAREIYVGHIQQEGEDTDEGVVEEIAQSIESWYEDIFNEEDDWEKAAILKEERIEELLSENQEIQRKLDEEKYNTSYLKDGLLKMVEFVRQWTGWTDSTDHDLDYQHVNCKRCEFQGLVADTFSEMCQEVDGDDGDQETDDDQETPVESSKRKMLATVIHRLLLVINFPAQNPERISAVSNAEYSIQDEEIEIEEDEE